MEVRCFIFYYTSLICFRGGKGMSIESTCVKRLRQELTEIISTPPPLCSAGINGDDIYSWTATIIGPPDTVYEGGVFHLNLDFPNNYPFKPPKVKFITKIFHCNVSSSGHICLDILDLKWTPAITVSSLLVSICSLMSDCNPKSPLMTNVAHLYLRNRKEHDRRAREYTRKFAILATALDPPSDQGDVGDKDKKV